MLVPIFLLLLNTLQVTSKGNIMSIADNLIRLRREIPPGVRIIAVSKTMPVSAIFEAYQAGQRAFGENRAQELADKKKQLPGDMEWHMIGHLQTNKVKLIIPFVHLVHSVDSLKLLSMIDAEARRAGRRVDCLLQMRIAREETKFGMTVEDVAQILDSAEFSSLGNVRITGLMGMATFTTDMEQVRQEFLQLAGHFTTVKSGWFQHSPAFREISMGMSGDYREAIAAGSTMVRIGSLIFGERVYI